MNEWLIELKFLFRLNCMCSYRARRSGEDQRDWLKDISCMYHWMKSKYYKQKIQNKKASEASRIDAR